MEKWGGTNSFHPIIIHTFAGNASVLFHFRQLCHHGGAAGAQGLVLAHGLYAVQHLPAASALGALGGLHSHLHLVAYGQSHLGHDEQVCHLVRIHLRQESVLGGNGDSHGGLQGLADLLLRPGLLQGGIYSGADLDDLIPLLHGVLVQCVFLEGLVHLIENHIAAHKDENETDRNVIIRQGNLVDNEPAFPVTNTIQGPGAIAKYSFAYCANEPMFLTNLGIYAITPSDIVGERFSQNRSYYMNGKLLAEAGKGDAYACVYKDMYWLCLNGVAYVLDGQQNLGANKNEPYSTRQYACFYETNIPARVMWVDETDLYFGADNGNVYQFYNDPDDIASYNDNGAVIYAEWETPDLAGTLFYKNKSFRYLALQMAPSVATSVTVFAMKRGIWNFAYLYLAITI